jgi:glycosyltransferase involved in cell wall biosynthesis
MTTTPATAVCPDVTVVVPTRNEADNVAPLVAALRAAFAESRARILFVDDSDDETPHRIADLMEDDPEIQLVHRSPGQRTGGLGSAVLTGVRLADSEWVVVMDGDLQHPPEIAPLLVERGQREDADLVVASRYVGDGDAGGLASRTRGWVSQLSTRLAKFVFPRRLRSCTDPMSGFFAVRPARLRDITLHPRGFKVLLEIIARSPRLRIRECPFTFGTRLAGQSKASLREGGIFLRRLLVLRLRTLLPGSRTGIAKVAGFAAVGASGIVVNSAALWSLVRGAHSPVLLAAILATQASTVWNFVLTDTVVFRGPKRHRLRRRFLGFAAINNALLVARLPVLAALLHLHVHYLVANAATLLAVFAVRFVLSDRLLFTRGKAMSIVEAPDTHRPAEPEPEPNRSGPVNVVIDLRSDARPPVHLRDTARRFHYDIHGIVTLGSVTALPELDYFRCDPMSAPDIVIEEGWFGDGHPRSRPVVTQYAQVPMVSYEEHLGRRGCNFLVDMTDGIRVVAGPLLVRSPHVLYTNVIEALLRFVMVSRGRMLLHSACLELDGHGLMLSALTDTGKTGTVLRLLRERGARFLSDDMTIIDGNGDARCFPKPLTISQHTLRAVDANVLSGAEWRRLIIQSKVHSKEGRGIGTRLGEMNLPIMGLNAVTQRVVPPPKYPAQRLVPCDGRDSIHVDALFVIERNEVRMTEIDPEPLLDELIANTDDAYGFPPFRYFAPALVVEGAGYGELRVRERMILAQAMRHVHARRLATPDFSWADRIPELLSAVEPAPEKSCEPQASTAPGEPTSPVSPV